MDIKKFSKKDEEYFKKIDGKTVAVENVLMGDDEDIYDKKKYRYDLSIYDGPLDLLLYLVRRNKIEIEDIFIPVYTPLDDVCSDCANIFSCFQDLFFCYSDDWNTDLRCSFANGYISYFYWIHVFCSSCFPITAASFVYTLPVLFFSTC